VTPWEEPSAYFGGHYNILFPKNVYWTKVRKEGQPFTEQDPVFGRVYHTGNTEDVQKMMDAEGAFWYHAHPRTEGHDRLSRSDLRQGVDRRTIATSAWPSSQAWAWISPRRGCASGGAST
jgi:hypothetical protein